jgi:curli production assembly/transport component CsgG
MCINIQINKYHSVLRSFLRRKILHLLVLPLFIFVSSCSSSFTPVKQDIFTQYKEDDITKELTALPKPSEKIVAAVYKFNSLTNQSRLSDSGTGWSATREQEETSILIKALEKSNWFITIEREGLSNLMNERDIIISNSKNPKNANGEELPPLLKADIILEGDVVAYESNLINDGKGAKYFGKSNSNQYQEDRATIYLRAISTKDGRVLKAVTTSKIILSQMQDIGLYKYVEFKKPLVTETSYSYDEPSNMCLTKAIEKAVYSLIIESVIDNVWAFGENFEKGQKLITDYLNEKKAPSIEDYADKLKPSARSMSIEIEGGFLTGLTDYSNMKNKDYEGIEIKVPLINNLDLGLSAGKGVLESEKIFSTDMYPITLKLFYNFAPDNFINPFVYGGIGLLQYYFNKQFGKRIENENSAINFCLGIGTEFNIYKTFSLNLKIENDMPLNDELDGIKNGKWYDTFWDARIGICFYPNR